MNTDDSIFQWMQNEDNKLVLILLRGVPSSGKSYRAAELSGGDPSVIQSADYFWGSTKEEYVANWDREKLFKAHSWCQRLVRERMQRQDPLVIVDNTHVRVADLMPYFDMAVQYQYRVQIEEPTSPWWVDEISPLLSDKDGNREGLAAAAMMLHRKNQETHCVPLESIQKMLSRFQPKATFSDLARRYCNRNPDEQV